MQDLSLYTSSFLPTADDIRTFMTRPGGWEQVTARAHLLNRDLSPKSMVIPVNPSDPSDVSLFIEQVRTAMDEAQDVMRSSSFLFHEDPRIGQINYLRDLIQVSYAAYDEFGNEVLEVPVGIFGFQIPDRHLSDAGNTLEVVGYDLSWQIARLTFEHTYVIPIGFNVIEAVGAILRACRLPPSDLGLDPDLVRLPAGVSLGSTPPAGIPYCATGLLVDETSFPPDPANHYLCPVSIPGGGTMHVNPFAGLLVDPTSHVPIDPWTCLPMERVGDGNYQTWQSSKAALQYLPSVGLFYGPGTQGYVDPFKLAPYPVGATSPLQCWLQPDAAYTSAEVYDCPYPYPLESWPYDYDRSGPYFQGQTAAAPAWYCPPVDTTSSTTTTTTPGSYGSGAYCPAAAGHTGYAIRDPGSGCVLEADGWHHPATTDHYPNGLRDWLYNPDIGTLIDAASGLPLDPVTCTQMHAVAVIVAGVSATYAQTDDGAYWFSVETGDFEVVGAPGPEYANPKTGALVAQGSDLLKTFGGDAYTPGTSSSSTLTPYYPVQDPRSRCYLTTLPQTGTALVYVHPAHLNSATTEAGAVTEWVYRPGCELVDPASGCVIDPVSCTPMTYQTFGYEAVGAFYTNSFMETSNHFYYNPEGWFQSAAEVDPTLGGPQAGPFYDPRTGLATTQADILCAYGGAVYTGAIAANVTAGGVPTSWPDINDPGLTPAGCDFYGPDIPPERIVIPPSDLVTTDNFVFSIKENVLNAINTLLASINYGPLWVDEWGIFRSAPIPFQYTDAEGNTVIPTGADWRFDSGMASIIEGGVSVKIADQVTSANVIIIRVENNKNPPITVVKENHAATSRLSIENLGYVLEKAIQDDHIPDLATAEIRALVELEYAATGDETISLNTAIIPFFQTGDRILLNIWSPDGKTLEVDSSYTNLYPFAVSSWAIDFNSRMMAIECRRLVAL